MASIRAALESSLDELEDLHTRGIFTREELRAVVKRRTEHEYALARRTPRVEDFERAIAYEKGLDRCRALRLRRARAAASKSGKKESLRKGVSDVSIKAKVHSLYERALRRFRGDLSMWLRYMEYCRAEAATKRLGRVAARCLRLHMTSPEAWVYIADVEADVHGNIQGARSLLQRAIRLNPRAEELWHELFRLELRFATQLKERRDALGIQVEEEHQGNGVADDDDDDEEEKEEEEDEEKRRWRRRRRRWRRKRRRIVGDGKQKDIDDDEVDDDEVDDDEVDDDEDNDEEEEDGEEDGAQGKMPATSAAMAKVLGGGAARIVFDRALDELKPTNVAFVAGFLKVLAEFRPDFLEVGERVCTVLQSVHERDVSAWEEVAKYMFGIAGTDAALAVLRDGAAKCPTERMYAACTSAMRQHTESLFAAGERAEAKRLVLETMRMCEAAEAKGIMGESLAQDHVRVLLQLGRRREAMKAALGATRVSPQSCSVWLMRLRLHERLRALGDDEGGEHAAHAKLIDDAIDAVPLTASAPVWMYAVQWYAGVGASQSMAGLTSRLVWALCVGGDSSTSLQSVACAVVDVLRERHGLRRAREAIDKLMVLPRPGLAFMMHCIELELEVLGETTPPSTDRLKALIESALVVYGSEEHDLWLRRWRLEKDANGNTGSIYWRAVKSLDDPKPFIAAIHKCT